MITSKSLAKHPVDPDRVRRMPRQFAPLDRQLVYGKHVCYMSPEQIALYTFLECVSDPEGLSYYSEKRICELLHFSLNGLWDARTHLIDAGCLLYRKPIYQLLNLPELISMKSDSLFIRQEGEAWQIVESDGRPIREVSEFLHALMLRGLRPGTYRTYAVDLLCAYRWMAPVGLELEQIGSEQLLQFVDCMRTPPAAAPSTINRRLRLFQRLIEFITGSPPTIPAWQTHPGRGFHARSRRAVVRVKEPRRVIQPLTDAEFHRFYNSLKKWRDRAMVLFMWAVGLRTMEVLNLRLSDIDVQRMNVLIRGKMSKERMMPICELIVKALDPYLKYERPESDETALFLVLKGPSRGQPMKSETVRRIFRYHRQISGIHNANPHRLRHCFGAMMTRSETPLLMLAQMMGHASPQTTMGYVKIDDREIRAHYLNALKKITPEKYLDEPEA